MAKKSTRKAKKHAVRQRDGDYEVGNAKPPKEHQFKPGESGNPKGPPKHRTNLWVWFCKYSNMTDAQLARLDRSKLTQAQQTALKIVEQGTSGAKPEWERMARYVVDREEGKAAEHLLIGGESELTDEECEQLKGRIRGNHADTDK